MNYENVDELVRQNEDIRKRLEDAEQVIQAIRSDQVDGFVVEQEGSNKVLLLESAEGPYRILVERMHQGAVAIDSDGRILYCNGRFCEMLRRRTDEVIGAPVHRFLASTSGPLGADSQGEFGLESADGSHTPVHITVNSLQDARAAAYLIVTDLTDHKARQKAEQAAAVLARELEERKRAEAALRASEARLAEADRRKNEFLAVLAHELRNPLGPIRNAVHVLDREPEGPLVAEARGIIERQVTHMARLTDDLLDVSRVAAGRLLLRRKRLDLVQLLSEVVEDYRGTLEAAGLALEFPLPEQPLWVNGDSTRLAQVMGNIIHNASKFTEAGGRVEICASESPDGKSALIAIRDTGMGMDAEALERIFDAFSLGARMGGSGQEGLGVGMALARGLIELHEGSIIAASEGRARGSQFTIRLPLLPEPQPDAITVHAAPALPRSYRILVIEDNPDAADSLQILLRLMGHVVKKAYNGPAGIEVARRFRPEVVLCDIGLPGNMSGYDVAHALRREISPGPAFMVALTGYGQEDDLRKAHEAGFDFHMIKPADPKELEQLLASLPV